MHVCGPDSNHSLVPQYERGTLMHSATRSIGGRVAADADNGTCNEQSRTASLTRVCWHSNACMCLYMQGDDLQGHVHVRRETSECNALMPLQAACRACSADAFSQALSSYGQCLFPAADQMRASTWAVDDHRPRYTASIHLLVQMC